MNDGYWSITCPFCWRTSYNANDVKNNYCPWCHVYIEEEIKLREMEREVRKVLLGEKE